MEKSRASNESNDINYDTDRYINSGNKQDDTKSQEKSTGRSTSSKKKKTLRR